MRLRDWLPWRDFAIETSWPPNVAAIEIRKHIASPRLFAQTDEPFVGESMTEKEFRFSRGIRYPNAFLPVIRAAVEPSYRDGARVRVRIRLHDGVVVFMAFWLAVAPSGLLLGGLASLVGGLAAGSIVIVLPVFGVGLLARAFSVEARKAEDLLRAIFAAAPGFPPPPDTGEPYR
jgi:hypothetical protein